jgi:hypothetical protein
MRTERLLKTSAWCCSLLLGHASILLGLMLTLGWGLATVLALPTTAQSWSAGPRLILPVEPPLIGLLLGATGLAIAWRNCLAIRRYAVAGLAINLMPLAFALVLLWLKSGR